MKSLLLVLTDIRDPKTRSLITMVLSGYGHKVIESTSPAQANTLLRNGLEPDLLFCEADASDLSGEPQYKKYLKLVPTRRVCLLIQESQRMQHITASKLGVQHFISLPVTREDVELLADLVTNTEKQLYPHVFNGDPEPVTTAGVIPTWGTRRNDPPAKIFVEELGGDSFFLAASPQMLEIHRQVKLLADIDVNVLILGESGTGKEVVAQLIHQNSRRNREEFLKVNCAALPAELLESELFGHRQGAFTGAIKDRPGKFEQANRGTLLLDEIGEIGVQMQAKLLHVLQDGQFARLGAQETTRVDVRVLAATNVQIENALCNRTFREDLYYRLSVFTIKVPPLRERREEIPYLIEEFIRRSPVEMTTGFPCILPSRLMDAALQYDWRGNLRELRNFVTRTLVMRDVDAAIRELEAKVQAATPVDSRGQSVENVHSCVGIRSVVRDVKARTEAQMILNALESFGWNRRRAAQHLEMSYRSLLYKIQQHHLKPWPTDEPQPSFQEVRSPNNTAI